MNHLFCLGQHQGKSAKIAFECYIESWHVLAKESLNQRRHFQRVVEIAAQLHHFSAMYCRHCPQVRATSVQTVDTQADCARPIDYRRGPKAKLLLPSHAQVFEIRAWSKLLVSFLGLEMDGRSKQVRRWMEICLQE